MATAKRFSRFIEVRATEDEEIHELRPDGVVKFRRVLKRKPWFQLVGAMDALGKIFDGERVDIRLMESALEAAMPIIAQCITGWNWVDLDDERPLSPTATTITNELSPIIEQVWLITAASEAYFNEKN